MSCAYKIYDQHSMNYATFTVHQWTDIFTRSIYINIVLERFGFGKKAIMALKLQVLIFLKPNSMISI
jgi:hypothetical protein